MGDGALGSDHVNYLILRYLQENGHENAAKAFYRDWDRPDEYQDPENLPFAHHVRQHELVNIIQDGLFHDQLQATVSDSNRRFKLLNPNNSRPTSSHRIPPKPTSRRPSAFVAPDQDDFPTPAPKRPRRSNGPDTYINGDAMDVDGTVQEDEGETTEPERAQSEPEPEAVIEEEPVEMSTAATQTDKESRIRTKTLYWTLDKRDPASFLHTAWNPQTAMSSRLLTVGEALCQLYNIPAPEFDGEAIIRAAPMDISRDAVISAATWHPSGRFYTCAMERPQINGRTDSHTMFDCSVDGAKRFYDSPAHMLNPRGMALTIRYSSSGDLMLTISTNGKRGLLQIWPTASMVKHREPIAAKIFDDIVLDAVWTSEDSICVCGHSLLAVYAIEHLPSQADGVLNGNSTITSGARNLRQVYKQATERSYDKVRFDSRHGVLAASSASDKTLSLLARHEGNWTAGPPVPRDEISSAIALAFQPLPTREESETSPDSPRRLAVALDSGNVHVYDVTPSSCDLAAKLSIGPSEPALAVAWAPNDAKLAVASDEAVKIWNLDASEPVVSWQAAPAKWFQGNEHNLPGDEDGQTEPSLSWDAHGHRLAFAVGKKVSLDTDLD